MAMFLRDHLLDAFLSSMYSLSVVCNDVTIMFFKLSLRSHKSLESSLILQESFLILSEELPDLVLRLYLHSNAVPSLMQCQVSVLVA